MALVPQGNFYLPAGSNLLTAFNEAARGWNEHGGFDEEPPRPVESPFTSSNRRRRRRRKKKRMRPDSSSKESGSKHSGSGDGSNNVGTENVIGCQVGLPYFELLPYPKPRGFTLVGGTTTSLGFGTRISPHVWMKGMKICRMFWRNPNNANHITGGDYLVNYCLIQMDKDRNITESSLDVAQVYKVFDKFFRDYSETDETYRKFEDIVVYPQTALADYKFHKLCASINPDNGMFKLLMRKKFTLKCPTSFNQQNLAGDTRSGTVLFEKYKKLPHRVSWEDNDNSVTPERPIYELWWAYPKSPAQNLNVSGSIHYQTCATNTMYYKNISNA